jgi:DNA-binding response OmpR family regulator
MYKVLLVEPDKSLGEVIAKYLSNHGLDVALAKHAQQAISQADATQPDLVVLELAIPKNNGLAFLQEFRSYTDWLHTPVIIYSRIPREDTAMSEAEWQKEGVTSYLYKPTKPLASLLNSIQDTLNNYEHI